MNDTELPIKTGGESPVKTTLDQHVRDLIINRPRTITLAELAHAADVSQSWLDAFIAGKIKNPGVRQIVEIYDFLSPVPLRF